MFKRLLGWLAGSSPRQSQTRRPQLEALESRLTPTNWIAVAPNPGTPGRVEVWDTAPGQTPVLVSRFVAFNGFSNGIRIALGDTDGDGTPEVFCAPGVGGAPQVQQFSFNGTSFILVRTINVFAGTFKPGLTLAVGDVRGDTTPELIVSHSRSGTNATIAIFDPNNPGTRLQTIISPNDGTTGVRLTTADINNDGKQDIIAAPETTTRTFLRVFVGGTTQVNPSSRTVVIAGFVGQGMNITSGNVDGVGGQDLIISPNSAVGTTRKIFYAKFNNSFTPIVQVASVQAANLYPNGIRVAGFDFDGNGLTDIATIAAVNGPRSVRILGTGGALRQSFSVFTFLPVNTKPGFDIAAITFA